MSEPYIGEIRMVAFNFPPAGWALCDGQLIAISQNDALFTLIGTAYGGDGQETFALPNLQSRLPMHAGTGPGLTNKVLAEAAGVEEVTLSTQQIPVHTHALLATTTAGDSATPQGNMSGQTFSNTYANLPPFQVMNAGVVQPVGGSQPHENMHPFLVISFIISLYGVFPQQT